MNKTLNRSTALTLIGLCWVWFGFLSANYIQIVERPTEDNYYEPNMLRASTFVFLIALVGFAVCSVLAFRSADSALAKKTPGAMPVYRFNAVGVITALVSLVMFVLIAFFNSFNGFGKVDVGQLVLGVYVPIVIAAGVAIVGLLMVTVYRKSDVLSTEVSKELKKQKREAALAFVYPTLGTTLALLIGLTVYQAQRENPQVWVWVVILAIVAGSIVLGSVYAARAKSHAPQAQSAVRRVPGTAALNLNFVLSAIFVLVVLLISFAFGLSAIQELNNFDIYAGAEAVKPITIEWFMHSMLPAILIFGLVNFSAYVAVRVRSIVAS